MTICDNTMSAYNMHHKDIALLRANGKPRISDRVEALSQCMFAIRVKVGAFKCFKAEEEE